MVNVIEDPAADPPIERQQELAASIAQAVEREFRSRFSPLVEGPVLVSARALAIERGKAEPRPETLATTGYDQLIETLELLLESPQRTARQCLGATATLDQAAGVLSGCEEAAERHRDALRAAAQAIECRLEEVSNTQLVLRRQVATLVQGKAAEICQRIAIQADQFIAAQLNASNFRAMFTSLTEEGRARLKAKLQEDFEVHYLRLRDHPNWLEITVRRLVDEVRELVISEWRRISQAQLERLEGDAGVAMAPIDMDQISADLQSAMLTVLAGGALAAGGFGGSMLTGGGLATIIGHSLVLLPVATLFLGLAVLLVAFGKPFKRRQDRTRERVRNEIEMHKHVVAERLEQAIWQSIGQIEQRLRQELEGTSGESKQHLAEASALVAALRRGHDRLLALRDTLERLANGEELGDEAAHA